MRGKDQYEMTKDDRGKASVQKLGVGAKQRDGFEYEFTCTFLIDQKTNTAETQKDNTHIFEYQGATLLTEEHGRKIIRWANEGSSYTPIDRNNTESTTTDDLASIQKAIIDKCVELGGQKNEELMTKLKEYTKTGNPKSIKSIDKAKECLEVISNLKGE